jgi:L-fuconolactonase
LKGRPDRKARTRSHGVLCAWLDVIWNAFGEDRLIYGSNWPVSELFAPLFEVQRIVEEYFAGKGRRVLEKVVAGNASVAYRWRRR